MGLAALALCLCAGLAASDASANDTDQAETDQAKTPRKPVKLPGLVVDFENKCVDVEAKVSLDAGLLEVVACVPDSKEHEALVVVKAVPMHIHAGLLMLGAKNGHPYTIKRIKNEDGSDRFIHLPARGDRVDVSLVYKNKAGKTIERPISDFIERSDEQGAPEAEQDQDEKKDKRGFPNTFIFAGSIVIDDDKGDGDGKATRRYLADESGHVISISTFGDELLCLPRHQSSDNSALAWQVGGKDLPKKGTKVTLRLRPKVDEKPDSKKDSAGKPEQNKPGDKPQPSPATGDDQ